MEIKDKMKRHFCYKSICVPQGIILLFETFKDFEDSDFKLNFFKGTLYVELGENVFLLTEKMLDHLLKSPYICICSGNAEYYDIYDVVKEIEVSYTDIAQIKGALAVIRNKPQLF